MRLLKFTLLTASLSAALLAQTPAGPPSTTPKVGHTAPDFTLPSTEGGKAELTARQREVLRLIAVGCSAKDIANQLNISVRTAEFHRAAIMQRLGLHSTAQMTRYAIANQLG